MITGACTQLCPTSVRLIHNELSDMSSWNFCVNFAVFCVIYSFLGYPGPSLINLKTFVFRCAAPGHKPKGHYVPVEHKNNTHFSYYFSVFSKGSSFQTMPSLSKLLEGVSECIVGEWD